MLTEADKKIISNDPALPGLAALLDTELLLAKLRAIPALCTVEKAEIEYLRYKPANSCACTVRIRLADGSSRYYYAKALTKERFKESWNKPSRQKLIQAGHPQAPLAVFDSHIMLLHPAHDRGIGHLKWLIDQAERRHLFKACSLPSLQDYDALEIDILRYKPERRLVARISKDRQPLAVIRCANPDEFTKMLMGNAFGVAQGGVHLLGADGANRTLATSWQKGRSLCPEEGEPPTADLVRQLARQVTRIHHAGYKHPIRYTIEDEAKSLKGVINTFKHILPEQTEWFVSLVERVEKGLASVPEHFALIHGDFSLDQVIRRENKLGETRLHILDWDRSAYGNPLMDLATFQARLELQVIEGILPRRRADEILDTFLNTYRKKSGTSLDGLYWFTASAMLRLGAEPFRKRDPRWEQCVLQLLQRIEEILAKTDDPYIPTAENDTCFSEDSPLITLLDVPKMQALLHDEKILPAHEHIQSAVLCRYKIRRRALVDYQTDTGHLIGKYRAKGLDERSHLIQQKLWESGFDTQAQTSVPETAGKLPALNTWFQYKVNGQNIGNILMPQNGRLVFLGQAVARAINALHRSRTAQELELPRWTQESELEILRDRLAKAQTTLPQWAKRIANVLDRCETLAQHLSETPFATVHRDFYQDQILERYGRPGHIVLLDFDLLCQGHAALDAGNYIAHIQELALRLYGGIDALKAHEDAFLRQFLADSETAKQKEVEIYTTLSLARHIYISTLFDNRKHTTETLLKLCESRLHSQTNKV